MKYKPAIEEIEIPQGFNARMNERILTVAGNGKTVTKNLPGKSVRVRVEDGKVKLLAERDDKKTVSKLNALRSHVKNAMEGLQKGYEYKLAVVFSHFPMTVQVKGNTVEIGNYLGQKKVRKAVICSGAEVQVKGKEVTVKGHDKDAVGQTAANIENASRIGGKDRRVFQDGVYIVSKGK